MGALNSLLTGDDAHYDKLHRLDSICNDMEDEFRSYLKSMVAENANPVPKEENSSHAAIDTATRLEMGLLHDFAVAQRKSGHYVGRVGKLSLEETAWIVQEKKLKELEEHHKKSLLLLTSIEAKQGCLDQTFREQRDATSLSIEAKFNYLVHQNFSLESRLNTALRAIEGVSAT